MTPSSISSGGGVAPWALDPESAERLWDLSLGTARLRS